MSDDDSGPLNTEPFGDVYVQWRGYDISARELRNADTTHKVAVVLSTTVMAAVVIHATLTTFYISAVGGGAFLAALPAGLFGDTDDDPVGEAALAVVAGCILAIAVVGGLLLVGRVSPGTVSFVPEDAPVSAVYATVGGLFFAPFSGVLALAINGLKGWVRPDETELDFLEE